MISLWPGIVKTEIVNELKKKLITFEENDVSMMKKRVRINNLIDF